MIVQIHNSVEFTASLNDQNLVMYYVLKLRAKQTRTMGLRKDYFFHIVKMV